MPSGPALARTEGLFISSKWAAWNDNEIHIMNEADANLIFIADDDPNQRMIVERWLSRANYEVTSLESGEVCLEALSEEQPAAICLDLNMPGFGGMNTLDRFTITTLCFL